MSRFAAQTTEGESSTSHSNHHREYAADVAYSTEEEEAKYAEARGMRHAAGQQHQMTRRELDDEQRQTGGQEQEEEEDDEFVRQQLFAHFSRSHSLPMVAPAPVPVAAAVQADRPALPRSHTQQPSVQHRSPLRPHPSALHHPIVESAEEEEEAEREHADESHRRRQQMEVVYPDDDDDAYMEAEYERRFAQQRHQQQQQHPLARSIPSQQQLNASNYQYPPSMHASSASPDSSFNASASSSSFQPRRSRRRPEDPLPGQGRLNEISRRLAEMGDRQKLAQSFGSNTPSRTSRAAAAAISPTIAATTVQDRSLATTMDDSYSHSRCSRTSGDLSQRSNLVDALRKMNRMRQERQLVAAPYLDSSYSNSRRSQQGDSFLSHSLNQTIPASAAGPLKIQHLQNLAPAPSRRVHPPARPDLIDYEDMPSFMRDPYAAASASPALAASSAYHAHAAAQAMSFAASQSQSQSRHTNSTMHDLSLSAILSASVAAAPPRLRDPLSAQPRTYSPPPLVAAALASSNQTQQQLRELQMAQLSLEQSHQALDVTMQAAQAHGHGPYGHTSAGRPPNNAFPSGASFLDPGATKGGAAAARAQAPDAPFERTAPRQKRPAGQSSLSPQARRRREQDAEDLVTPAEQNDFYLYEADPRIAAEERQLAQSMDATRQQPKHSPRDVLIARQEQLLNQQQQMLHFALSGHGFAQGSPVPAMSPAQRQRDEELAEAYGHPSAAAMGPSAKALQQATAASERVWDEVDQVLAPKPSPQARATRGPSASPSRHSTVEEEALESLANSTIAHPGVASGQPQIVVHVHNHMGPTDTATTVKKKKSSSSPPTSSLSPATSASSQPTPSTRSPLREAALAAAQRHFSVARPPAVLVDPLDTRQAQELERQKGVFANKTGQQAPRRATPEEQEYMQQRSHETSSGLRPRGAFVEELDPSHADGGISEQELDRRAMAIVAQEHAQELRQYMAQFNALESKLTGGPVHDGFELDPYSLDIDQAIAAHRITQARFEMAEASASPHDDRYVDHLIAQKQVLFQRLQDLEISEARARQQERLEFEMDLASIEEDARLRDEWRAEQMLQQKGAQDQAQRKAQVKSPGTAKRKTTKAVPSSKKKRNSTSSSTRSPAVPAQVREEEFGDQHDQPEQDSRGQDDSYYNDNDAEGEHGDPDAPPLDFSPGSFFAGGDPTLDAEQALEERAARSRIATARSHMAEMGDLDETAQFAVSQARGDGDNEFEAELAAERAQRATKWQREALAIEAHTRRVIEAQMEVEAVGRQQAATRQTERAEAEAQSRALAQQAEQLEADEMKRWTDQRDSWLARQKAERDEWEQRRIEAAERTARSRQEAADDAAREHVDKEIALRTAIEQQVSARFEAQTKEEAAARRIEQEVRGRLEKEQADKQAERDKLAQQRSRIQALEIEGQQSRLREQQIAIEAGRVAQARYVSQVQGAASFDAVAPGPFATISAATTNPPSPVRTSARPSARVAPTYARDHRLDAAELEDDYMDATHHQAGQSYEFDDDDEAFLDATHSRESDTDVLAALTSTLRSRQLQQQASAIAATKAAIVDIQLHAPIVSSVASATRAPASSSRLASTHRPASPTSPAVAISRRAAVASPPSPVAASSRRADIAPASPTASAGPFSRRAAGPASPSASASLPAAALGAPASIAASRLLSGAPTSSISSAAPSSRSTFIAPAAAPVSRRGDVAPASPTASGTRLTTSASIASASPVSQRAAAALSPPAKVSQRATATPALLEPPVSRPAVAGASLAAPVSGAATPQMALSARATSPPAATVQAPLVALQPSLPASVAVTPVASAGNTPREGGPPALPSLPASATSTHRAHSAQILQQLQSSDSAAPPPPPNNLPSLPSSADNTHRQAGQFTNSALPSLPASGKSTHRPSVNPAEPEYTPRSHRDENEQPPRAPYDPADADDFHDDHDAYVQGGAHGKYLDEDGERELLEIEERERQAIEAALAPTPEDEYEDDAYPEHAAQQPSREPTIDEQLAEYARKLESAGQRARERAALNPATLGLPLRDPSKTIPPVALDRSMSLDESVDEFGFPKSRGVPEEEEGEGEDADYGEASQAEVSYDRAPSYNQAPTPVVAAVVIPTAVSVAPSRDLASAAVSARAPVAASSVHVSNAPSVRVSAAASVRPSAAASAQPSAQPSAATLARAPASAQPSARVADIAAASYGDSSSNFDWMNSAADEDFQVDVQPPQPDWRAARAERWKSAASATTVSVAAAASPVRSTPSASPMFSSTSSTVASIPSATTSVRTPIAAAAPMLPSASVTPVVSSRLRAPSSVYSVQGSRSPSMTPRDDEMGDAIDYGQITNRPSDRPDYTPREDERARMEAERLDALVDELAPLDDFGGSQARSTPFGASLRSGSSNLSQHLAPADANDTLMFSPAAHHVHSRDRPYASDAHDAQSADDEFADDREIAALEQALKSSQQASSTRAQQQRFLARAHAAALGHEPVRDHYEDGVREHDDPAVRGHVDPLDQTHDEDPNASFAHDILDDDFDQFLP